MLNNEFGMKRRMSKPEVSTDSGRDFINTQREFCTYDDHIPYEEMMKFVTAIKSEILNEPKKFIQILSHLCQCEYCQNIKNEMINSESEIEMALSFTNKSNID